MILDNLENSEIYYPLHKNFGNAFKFLERNDLNDLPDGKYEIDGKEIFALISRKNGKSSSDAKLEAHKEYIDIQVLLSDEEKIGWKLLSLCKNETEPFNQEKDIIFFNDKIQTCFELNRNDFAVFFPTDAHAPMIGNGIIHKVVIKVKVD